jgi:hypothetical protein
LTPHLTRIALRIRGARRVRRWLLSRKRVKICLPHSHDVKFGIFELSGALTGMVCDDPNQLTCHGPQRRSPFPQRPFACPSSASIWLPLVLHNARGRTNLSSHVARGTNLPFGRPSRDIGCRRSLIAGNARKKAASSRRRTLIMSRLMEISGPGLWIMRTRKACAHGTTTPRDNLGKWGRSASCCAASDAVCIAQR